VEGSFLNSGYEELASGISVIMHVLP
jgi:hypothetical protein